MPHNLLSYLRVSLHFSLLLFIMLGCSGSDDEPGTSEEPQSFNLIGTYCLDFAIVGSQMVIESTTTEGSYNVQINDFDGGLRSGSGVGTLNGTTLSVDGTMSTEAGNGNFELNLAIDETNELLSGLFEVIGPNGNVLFNSSLQGAKGNCSPPLTPEDVDNIIGQPLLTSAHVELEKIKKISRFRSAAGHNFVDYSGESCVCLKHYFHTYSGGGDPILSELPASMDYFVPADGTIVTMGQARPSEDPTDFEVDIRLSANENVVIRVFHITPASGIRVGATVTSGQVLGSSPEAHRDSGDFAVYVLTNDGFRHISMFEIMSNEVLARFASRGLSTAWRSDLYYETDDPYVRDIFCENGTWGNLRHPASMFELNWFFLTE